MTRRAVAGSLEELAEEVVYVVQRCNPNVNQLGVVMSRYGLCTRFSRVRNRMSAQVSGEHRAI